MDLRQLFFTSYETVLAVLFGLMTVFITVKVFDLILLRGDSEKTIKGGNVALGIFGGAVVISVLLLVQTSIDPAVSSLQVLVTGTAEITVFMVLKSLGFFLLFYVISTAISMILLFLATNFYMLATTKVDEITEMKNGNIAVAVMLSCVILAMTLFIRPSVGRFLSSLVNYDVSNTDKQVQTIEKEVEKRKGDVIKPSSGVMPE